MKPPRSVLPGWHTSLTRRNVSVSRVSRVSRVSPQGLRRGLGW
ncbi:hypothetical protein ACFPRL_19080 [Pseudoclavibacter helvolus]